MRLTICILTLALVSLLSACNKDNGSTPTPENAVITLTADPLSQTEGNADTATFDIVVTLSKAPTQDISVDYATADGTALLTDNDYQQAQGTLTVPAGETTGTIQIVIVGDTRAENDETFYLNLSNPQGIEIQSPSISIAIVNDDALIAGPTGLTSNLVRQTLTLDWDVVPNASKYTVYWSDTNDLGLAGTAQDVTQANYMQENLEFGKTYFFRVTATISGVETEVSDPLTLSLDGTLLADLVFDDTNLATCITNMNLVYAGELYNLNCSNTVISSLQGVESLFNLEYLSIDESAITDLSPLSDLQHLISIYLFRWSIVVETPMSVEPLRNMTQLDYLAISRHNVTDITPMENLTNLTSLYIEENNIGNNDIIKRFTELQTLWASSTGMSDVSNLNTLTKMRTLVISNNGITNMGVVASMPELEHLDVRRNNISNFSAITDLANLNALIIDNNNANGLDSIPLKIFPQLTTASFGGSNISDLSKIVNLTKVTRLFLQGNSITDVDLLAGLTTLQTLNISNNLIGNNVTGNADKLADLPNLNKLFIFSNPTISCAELDHLTTTLGTTVVNTDGNCTTP